ncbi:hypothetical protein O6H91_16G067000 [Diphasiastrum complanatum]|uniref:Uncharacterized protein n=2 Tax=Diphasiastrum complanatum TaxID=34168 RepID=A0ACC2BCD5_DIPCM|nr:hypothetical protein O6H91_16G051100 [Diphasiastrum complanatum]KAJ7527697.1 hypothetical protein O6H91_16G067000 [Diphasiastrum complanatum]
MTATAMAAGFAPAWRHRTPIPQKQRAGCKGVLVPGLPRSRRQRTSSRSIWQCRLEISRCKLSKDWKACDSYIDSVNSNPGGLNQAVAPEEQDFGAEIPAYQNGLYERLWRFSVPLILAFLHSSLLPVALTSFVGQFCIFVGGPWVGSFLDSMPRVSAFISLSCLQTISMIISAGVLIHALHKGPAMGSSSSVLLLQPWFIVLLLAGAVERVTGLATGVAFERDWVVLLAGPYRTVALAKANAILRRVDLICEMAGPSLFGFLLSKYNIFICINATAVIMLVSLLLVIILVQFTDKLSNGVLTRTKFLEIHNLSAAYSFSESGLQGLAVESMNFMKRGWNAYLAQPVLPASLAYILLYFNAVLSPGGLMTSFLSQSGLNPSVITLFRGNCALMGFLATFLSSRLIAEFGVLMAGGVALTFQMVLLLLTVIVHWSHPWGYQFSTYIFIGLIAVSRLGYWTYDIVNAQIFQTVLRTPQANLLGIMELSLASLAELAMMGIAIVASDVSYFGRLATLSMSAVAAATFLYWNWMLKYIKNQRQLSSDGLFIESEATGP